MTKTNPELYCSRCQCQVKPIKSLINYCCPKCGATFMASQVEPDEKIRESAENAVPAASAG